MQVIVNISLKEGVLDPQGRAIGRSLTDLGFQEVGEVRVGKRISLDIDESDPARAEQRVARMCETLLANTVIEDYEIEIAGDDMAGDDMAGDDMAGETTSPETSSGETGA